MWLRERAIGTTALMRRDLIVRFGRDNIGFAWVIVEPMILTVGVMLMWIMLKAPYDHGIAVVALVLTGYMPITLFRHITNSHVNLLRQSASLFYHRGISTWDVIAARVLTETAGVSIALMVVYSVLLIAGQIEPVEDIRLVVWAWLLMGFLATGLAVCFAALTQLSEVAERFIQTFQYILLPISGTFYMVDWLPYEVQEVIWYVPLVHCFEMFRAGFFGTKMTTYYAPLYPFAFGAILLLVGGIALRRARATLEIG
jgi:capsular polysaccharide transport system permease protein